ncbi:sensor histidine kinase [Jiella marina]|uniref:sensor histidine kinase n=1 Tax=Jiella sp. LLJ827 TaxID=2917712 RepID=UPI00210093FC|nr:HAMP domain-containing sensor histidine kinase [Jiella sp. LLJ827]MCQ0988840.1 HAMP domain-containing histidine kinase [Jiella sp. LLJ827]
MRHASKRRESAGSGAASAIRTLQIRLDDFVSPTVTEASERRFQARILAALVAIGLVAALTSPVLAGLGASVTIAAMPLLVASLALAAAAWLSLSGRCDGVLWVAGSLGAGISAALATAVGWPLVAVIAILVILPVEGLIARRYRLAGGLALSSTALGAILVFEQPALLGTATPDWGHLLLALLTLGYAARLAWPHGRAVGRMRRKPAPVARDSRLARRSVADELGIAIFEVTPLGRIGYASCAAAELAAVEEGSLEGRLFGELCHVTDRLEVMRLVDAARSGAEPATVAARLRATDGSYREAELTIRALGSTEVTGKQGTDGESLYILVAARPMPAELEAARRILADLEEAQQASAAKTRFLATVSHELRTPLNAIIGFSDVLDHEYFGSFESPKQKEYVGLIRRSGQHLLSLVNTLLDVSKIEAGRYELHLERFDVTPLMQEIGELMREEARAKGLRLDIRLPAAETELVADRRACHQILLNLVSNALKFTETGVVTVESRSVEGACELLVSDTGIGIAEADLARLGRPFVQVSSGLSRRYHGTGLGLSLVKGLAELHTGSMTVKSQPGVGTMVMIRLPVAGPAATTPPQENIVALSNARSKTNSKGEIRQGRLSA